MKRIMMLLAFIAVVAPAKAQHILPLLPYAAEALEPAIDAETMRIHHGRHHKAYVDNLNAALANEAALAGLSLDAFKAEFNRTATSRFGSGWAWLVLADGKLKLGFTPNQDNPLIDGGELTGVPILAVDVREHACYLKYQNRRADYLSAWWQVVNWNEVNRRFAAAMETK
jgi:Fe-Mn family superoxide dismutase